MNCPYDKKVTCDTQTRREEIHRQLDDANAKGKIVKFKPGEHTEQCPLNPHKCLHFAVCNGKCR